MLEMSAFETLQGGQLTISARLTKLNYVNMKAIFPVMNTT